MAEQRMAYTGERIDVGIDVHKETYTVTCLCQRQIVKTATVPADPAPYLDIHEGLLFSLQGGISY
jgi:hypothetical protein